MQSISLNAKTYPTVQRDIAVPLNFQNVSRAPIMKILAGVTIHFLDVKKFQELSVSHLAGLGAVFYYRNKRVIAQAGEENIFSCWKQQQFARWVLSHRTYEQRV